MVNIKCIDLSGIPVVQEGVFHATNNQFQKAGLKGFIQVKVLENDNLYVRVDLPGVPDDAVRYRVDGVRQKVVFFSGETLGDVNEKDGVREYSGTAGLACNCCEITNVDAKMKDGVLRMILSRVKVNKDDQNKCTLTLPPFTGKTGRIVEDHPYVVKGRKGACFMGSTVDGGVYFTVDIPGVFKDDVQVTTNETVVRFVAENKNVYEHDESGRIYAGRINNHPSFSSLPSFSSHTITWNAEFGVLKMFVTPPLNTNNNN
ncbi:putative 57 kDa heat shock protein [Cardamine amara subsp. amara]|uniref:57 kDa heat shock protein n=1 Tax=Cardamine amara subsp. amara TaxID=228776 RepID=A0ABD1BI96_CARAN